MDPRFLEEDEILLELDIRDMDKEDSRALEFLSERIEEEIAGIKVMPMQLHRWFKTITGEISELSWKLSSIVISTGNIQELAKCRTRLMHLKGRMIRLVPHSGGNAQVAKLEVEIDVSLANCSELLARKIAMGSADHLAPVVEAEAEKQGRELLGKMKNVSEAAGQDQTGSQSSLDPKSQLFAGASAENQESASCQSNLKALTKPPVAIPQVQTDTAGPSGQAQANKSNAGSHADLTLGNNGPDNQNRYSKGNSINSHTTSSVPFSQPPQLIPPSQRFVNNAVEMSQVNDESSSRFEASSHRPNPPAVQFRVIDDFYGANLNRSALGFSRVENRSADNQSFPVRPQREMRPVIPPNNFQLEALGRSEEFLSRPYVVNPHSVYNQPIDQDRAQAAGRGSPGNAAMGWTMVKWPLRFGGGAKELPVEEFIFRAETLARLANLPFAALVLGLHQLLTGAAASWYWVYIRNEPNASWAQVRASLIAAFQSNVSDAAIRRRIMDRMQRNGERFTEFSIAIHEMEVRLANRMTENELLETLRRNMLPHVQDRLLFVTIRSVRELQARVHQVEELAQRQLEVQQFRRPSGYVHELSASPPSGLEYGIAQRYAQNSSHVGDNQPSALGSADISSNPFARPNEQMSMLDTHTQQADARDWMCAVGPPANRGQFLVCWNCDDIGHTYMDCTASRRIFCYGCGAKNCIRPQCPTCSVRNLQGNGRRNVRPNVQQQVRPNRGEPAFQQPAHQPRNK